MLDICNVLYLLKENKGELRNVEITGILTRKLDRPESLKDSVSVDSEGCFVEIDCVAVKFYGDDYVRLATGDGTPDKVYLVNGKLVTFINKHQIINDIWSIRGRLTLGKKDLNCKLVTMFNFIKKGNNWGIKPYSCKDVDIRNWRHEGRPSYYTSLSYKSGYIVRPKDILGTPMFVSELDKGNDTLNSFAGILNNSGVDNMNLGKSTNIPKGIIEPEVNIIESTNESSRFIFSRNEIEPKNNKLYLEFTDVMREARNKRDTQLEVIKDKISESNTSLYDRILRNISNNWSNRSSKYSRTGRSIFKEYVSKSAYANDEYLGKSVKKYLESIHDEVIEFALGEMDVVTAHKSALKAVRELFGDTEIALGGLLSVITGVSLAGVAKDCYDEGVCLSAILSTNPYMLMLVSNSLSFNDIETLAICLGFSGKPELRPQRNMMLLLEYIEKSNGNNTAYTSKDILKSNIGLTLTEKQYTDNRKYNHYFTSGKFDIIKTFLGVEINTHYNEENFVKMGYSYICRLSDMEIRKACNGLLTIGLCVSFKKDDNTYVESYNMFRKELYVYNKLYELLEENDGDTISQDVIDSCIKEFEDRKGFKLEEKQISAINLIKNKVFAIYGLPGGGKTTIIECCVDILKKEFGDDYEIQFAAPTGIASKRLSTVTGNKAGTMHSKFKVGLKINNKEDDRDDRYTVRGDCFVFDEMGMVTVNLLYEIFRKLRNPRIIFSGDIAQLAPIGKGIPFKDIVSIIPTETLMVSKRSTSDSNIALNNLIISDKSQGYEIEPLRDGNDFCIMECNNDDLPNKVCEIVKGYLDNTIQSKLDSNKYETLAKLKVEPSEIQVITPLAQSKFSWGTKQMNMRLQNIFNPRKNFYFKVGNQDGLELRVGDRVLNKDNSHKFLHYRFDGKCSFTKTWEFGVVNGDIGEILGVISANKCKFFDQTDEEPEDSTFENADIKDDEEFCEEPNAKFLVVKYDDYVVLYVCYVNEEYSTEVEPVLTGKELNMLDLAYALTVHKIQGGQNKLIIFMLGSMNYNSNFISNNLILTGVTRAREGEFLIGDVGSSDASTLTKGRKRFQHKDVLSANSLLYEED